MSKISWGILGLLCSILLLGLVSCQNDEQQSTSKPSLTTEPSSSTTNVATEDTSSETSEEWETMILSPDVYMYTSDYEKYGAEVAMVFYNWRQNGNTDPYSNVVFYENGTDISFESAKNTYSISSDLEWTVRCLSISDNLTVKDYVPAWALNVEKLENGEWVRCTILNIEKASSRKPIGDAAGDTKRKNELLSTEHTITVSEIHSEITPGQYRFIFYVGVEAGKGIEYRGYYIPFTVIE